MNERTSRGITIPVADDGGFSLSGEHRGKQRFLFACWPFVGHINPYLSVATALRDLGHDVAFYTGETARRTVEREGFTIWPFQYVSEELAYERVGAVDTASPGDRPGSTRVLRAFQDWLVGTIPDQVADLEPILEQWQPDVVVTETAMWGPILVLWETQQRPVAILSTLLTCLVPGPDAPPAGLGLPPPRTPRSRFVAKAAGFATELLATKLRRRVDRMRTGYSLPPLGCSVNAFTGRLPLYLIGNIPELDYERRDLPPSVRYVGPCAVDRDTGENADWLDQVPTGRPWVHVTEGTLRYGEPFVLRAAARGLGNQPVEAILGAGPQRDLNNLDMGPLAANVRVVQWVSHRALLPRCSAMVTTGGAGTVMAGLRAGLPLVVVPTTWDKPDNARRVAAAGAGVVLSPRACTPEGLRKAVEQVLGDPRYRANARRLAGQLAVAPGPAGAAELLEALATSRAPIV
jgi:UDP:flavonoid glycosyltransferase YjiC (YdhE family)